jgi:hypothetical protein
MTYPEKKSVYFAYPLYGHSGTQDDHFFDAPARFGNNERLPETGSYPERKNLSF